MAIGQGAYRTGLARFDEATGGLEGMMYLAGPAYSGRSALALAIAHGALAEHPQLCGLYITLTLDVDTLNFRLTARESGIPVSRLRSRQLQGSDFRPLLDADAALTRDVRPRLWLTASVGPEPADPDTITGRPFDANVALDYRNRLVQATGATGCLIVVDDFASIGVPRGSVTTSSDAYAADYSYDPVRLNRLDWLKRMTGDPLLVVAGVRKQTYPSWPYQIRGTSQIVETAASVAFLEPKSEPGDLKDDVQRLTLHVTKARYGRPADISLDFDVERFRFTEVTDNADKPRTSRKRRST
jgi:hypothetical protein